MLNKQFISAFTGQKTYDWGLDLYRHGMVHDVDVIPDRDTGLIRVMGSVENMTGDADEVEVLINESGWIIDTECTCDFYWRYHHPCNHIAALLICYVEEYQTPALWKPVKRKTDSVLKALFSDLDNTNGELLAQKVVLEPYIAFRYFGYEKPMIELKIGVPGKHMYIIQNLTEFAANVRDRNKKKYGKELEFVHDPENFAAPCRKLLDLIVSAVNREDSVSDDNIYGFNSWGYGSYRQIGRNLSLTGRYMDLFVDAVQDLNLYVLEPSDYNTPRQVLYTIEEGMPDLDIQIEKNEEGMSFTGTAPIIYKGHSYLYFLDRKTKRILKTKRDNRNLELLLEVLEDHSNEEMFIAEEDLPAFSQTLYPLLPKKIKENIPGFDVALYKAREPRFEIYLDLPQDDMITCELYALYDDEKYNVLAGIDADNRRNVRMEKEMDAYTGSWFNSFDPENKRMALLNDEDRMYTFLTEGIPALQDRADVFVSDRLKRIQVRQAPKVTIGVSVNHDLLQLHLVPDEMSLKEIGEIIYKYDRRKKYYRLKNGAFVHVDESLDQVRDVVDNLHLTQSQVTAGDIEVPKFRAFYLDELDDEGNYVSVDKTFRQMVNKMRNIDPSRYEVPQEMQNILREYQIDGFRWLCALRDNGFGALLADEMGLGKTLQVIAVLGEWKQRKRSLIVCPSSLVYNWASEIRRFMPSLHYKMVTGNSSLRKNQILSSREDDILITSYDLLKRDLETYMQLEFSCQVIDEAQYIKNAGTQAARAVKAINSSYRIALTGTPIENRLSELWSIFDFILPGFFHSYERFRHSYELPIVRDEDTETEEELRKMIETFILRRRKKDVLKDLPDKLEEVYYAPLEGEQKQLYEARVQRLKKMLENQNDAEFRENRIEVLSELTQLREICCDPSLIYENYGGNAAKRELCLETIRRAIAGGHKVLLFSQFVRMLKELTDDLDKDKIKYHLLTGDTPKEKRAEMVESFQSDDVPVFCISLKAGGTGLNLTAADIVIHYDPWWNTAVENQASDRAHRIGQTNVVTVYRLIMEDSIEERILALQKEKSDLAGRMLSGEGVSSARLSREDLLNILR